MKKIFSLIFITFATVSFAVSEVSFSIGAGTLDTIKTDPNEASVRIGSGIQLIADLKLWEVNNKKDDVGIFGFEKRKLDLLIAGAGLGYNLNFGRLDITPGVLINFMDFEFERRDSNTMKSDGKLEKIRFIPSLDLNAKLRIFGPVGVYGRVSMFFDRDKTVLTSLGVSLTFGRRKINDSDEYYFDDYGWEEYYE